MVNFFAVFLRLAKQILNLTLLYFEAAERDLVAAYRAGILLVDPLRDALEVEEVRLAGENNHQAFLPMTLRSFHVSDAVGLGAAILEIFHTDAAALEGARP